MDPELEAYLDGMVETLTARMSELIAPVEQRLARLEQRMERLEHRLDGLERRRHALHLEFSEKFIAVDDRFRASESCI